MFALFFWKNSNLPEFYNKLVTKHNKSMINTSQRVSNKNMKKQSKPSLIWDRPLYYKKKPRFWEENNEIDDFMLIMAKKSPIISTNKDLKERIEGVATKVSKYSFLFLTNQLGSHF